MTVNELILFINSVYRTASLINVSGQQNVHNMDLVLSSLSKLSEMLSKPHKERDGGEPNA